MRITNKMIITSFTIICLIIFLYGYTWIETSFRSRRFLEEAKNSYSQGDFIKAIKGGDVVIDGNYVFVGGLQQVCTAWESPLAWPKPDVYNTALNLLDKIIDKEMTIDIGMQLFKNYFQLDRKYLDRILLRVGDLYYEHGEYQQAKDIYKNAQEIFVHNKNLQTYTSKRLEEMNTLK